MPPVAVLVAVFTVVTVASCVMRRHKQRRLFMMYDLQPNRELTGGAMYTTDSMELDHDFIQSLRKFVMKVLTKAGPCSRAVLSRRLEASRISTVSLSTEEMQQVLDTLEYDGKIKRVDARLAGYEDDEESERVRRLVSAAYSSLALALTSCVAGCFGCVYHRTCPMPSQNGSPCLTRCLRCRAVCALCSKTARLVV